MTTTIRRTTRDDVKSMYELYTATAAIPGGLARLADEVTQEYVQTILTKSLARGLSLVDERDQRVVGEIHAYAPDLFCFSHVFSELTIAIHPEFQGQGLGRALFTQFMNRVRQEFPHILRVELIARESNRHAIALYTSLGFQEEGQLRRRIKNLDGTLESDIPMAWLRDSV